MPIILPGKQVSLDGSLNFSEKWLVEGPGDCSDALLLLGDDKACTEEE